MSIFDKILSGELPCYRIYEDAQVLAFLDIQPLATGHTLLIPKERVAQLHDLSEASAAALGRALPRLCRAVRETTGCADYNVLQNNGASAHQAVMHVHFHIIPKPRSGEGLGIQWQPRALVTEEAEQLAAKLRDALAT